MVKTAKFIFQDEIRELSIAFARVLNRQLLIIEIESYEDVPLKITSNGAGLCKCISDDTFEVLIPFLYKSIIPFTIDNYGECTNADSNAYFFVIKRVPKVTTYGLYTIKQGKAICIIDDLKRKISVNYGKLFFGFYKGGKVGIIKKGEIVLPAKYTKISVHNYSYVTDTTAPRLLPWDNVYTNLYIISDRKHEWVFMDGKEYLFGEYEAVEADDYGNILAVKGCGEFFWLKFDNTIKMFTASPIETDGSGKIEIEYNYWFNIQSFKFEGVEDDTNWWTEEDTWDAMTDGQYGEYPGVAIDYEKLGF